MERHTIPSPLLDFRQKYQHENSSKKNGVDAHKEDHVLCLLAGRERLDFPVGNSLASSIVAKPEGVFSGVVSIWKPS